MYRFSISIICLAVIVGVPVAITNILIYRIIYGILFHLICGTILLVLFCNPDDYPPSRVIIKILFFWLPGIWSERIKDWVWSDI